MFQEAIEAAQNEHLNDLNININWHAAPEGGWERIMTMFAAGEAYDIQRIDDDRVYLLALENQIHQLDPWMLDPSIGTEVDEYYPRFWTSLAIEGYQFAMLPAASANVVYYNIDHFEEAGITAPTSWADAWSLETFLDNVRRLAEVSGEYGVGFPPNISTAIGYGAGATALNEDQTECGFDNEDVLNALDPFVSLVVEEGIAVPPEIEQLEMFNSGLLAMMWGAMDTVAQISQGIRWDIMPWVKTPQFAMTENYDRAFVIPKTAKDPEAAYLALKALTKKASADIYARTRWGVPNLIASAEGEAFEDPSVPPENKNVWIETFGSVNGHQVDVPTPRGPIGEVWKQAFTGEELWGSLISGQISTAEFLERACARVNEEITRQEWSLTEGLTRLQESGALTDPDARVLASSGLNTVPGDDIDPERPSTPSA
jgi:multiple sugar transport system substrate-binding protein